MRHALLLIAAVALAPVPGASARAQSAVQAPPADESAAAPADATPAPRALEPFLATYEAWYDGRRAGTATMQLVHDEANRWRIDLGVRGDRGFAGIVGLNIDQSTVFDQVDGEYRPLAQGSRHAFGELAWCLADIAGPPGTFTESSKPLVEVDMSTPLRSFRTICPHLRKPRPQPPAESPESDEQ